jgi:hypothetical protein
METDRSQKWRKQAGIGGDCGQLEVICYQEGAATTQVQLLLSCQITHQNVQKSPAPVADGSRHLTNPSYLGGWDLKGRGLRPAQWDRLRDPVSTIPRAKWTGDVAQTVDCPLCTIFCSYFSMKATQLKVSVTFPIFKRRQWAQNFQLKSQPWYCQHAGEEGQRPGLLRSRVLFNGGPSSGKLSLSLTRCSSANGRCTGSPYVPLCSSSSVPVLTRTWRLCKRAV